jgi:predicted PurR-regulated permease PerM
MEKLKSDNYLKVVAGMFLVALVYVILKEMQSVMLPLIVAVIIAVIFEPFHRWLQTKRVPGFASIIIIIIIILIISNITSLFVFTSFTSFKEAIPRYQEKFTVMYASFAAWLESSEIFKAYFAKSINLSSLVTGERVGSIMEGILSGVLGLFGNYVLIMIYVVFLLTEIGSVRDRVRLAFSKENSTRISLIIENIFTDIKKYLVGKTLINLTHAVLVYIILLLFGADFAIVWGFLTFFMAFIPNIGPFFATILPFAAVLIQFDSTGSAIVLLILLVVVGFVMGNIVEPKIFGNTLNLSPFLILASLIFWGYLWGIMGMLLSVPILSMIKITLSKFDSTRPVSILMSHVVTPAMIKTDKEAKGTMPTKKKFSLFAKKEDK